MALIDSSLIAALGFLFNKTVTIQEPTEAPDAFGELVATWADKSGHVAIPCVLAPSTQREGGKRVDHVEAIPRFKFTLQGHYPLITDQMRAVCGGVTYNIVLALSDSQDLITTLTCEIVS